MNKYEIMYILKPTLDEAGIKEVRAEVEGYLTNNGATIDSENVWGLKDFAYEISDFDKGFYVVLDVTAGNEAITEYTRLSRINKNELRNIIIAKEAK